MVGGKCKNRAANRALLDWNVRNAWNKRLPTGLGGGGGRVSALRMRRHGPLSAVRCLILPSSRAGACRSSCHNYLFVFHSACRVCSPPCKRSCSNPSFVSDATNCSESNFTHCLVLHISNRNYFSQQVCFTDTQLLLHTFITKQRNWGPVEYLWLFLLPPKEPINLHVWE
jgi:hypothetical protein